jgi:Cys-tRNA(Pro) deacylase
MPLERVKQVLAKYPDLQFHLFDASTHTADLAAQALGVTPGQIAKTLVFLADGKPLLVVACGDRRVDTKKLAKIFGAKKLKFADGDTVLALTGFPPGGVSPIGSLLPIPVYVDQSLYQYDIVYAAAGTANSALPISPDRLLEITEGSLIDVCIK